MKFFLFMILNRLYVLTRVTPLLSLHRWLFGVDSFLGDLHYQLSNKPTWVNTLEVLN